MKKGKILTKDTEIKSVLENSKTIAVLGLSPKPERDSNKVASYLKEKGFKIMPVNPAQKEILREKVFASLDDINEPVDIIDVFRQSTQVLPHAHEALRLKPKVFWMQLTVENQEAAELLTDAGIDVIMNRCIQIEYAKLFR